MPETTKEDQQIIDEVNAQKKAGSDTTPVKEEEFFDDFGNKLEQRKGLDAYGNEQTFLVLVLDDHKKLPAATDFTQEYEMPILGTNQSMKFKLIGLSYLQWEMLEIDFIIPDKDEFANEADFNDALEEMFLGKKMRLIELSAGFEIPGKTPKEKEAALIERASGEDEALYQFIKERVCNVKDGHGSLVKKYENAMVTLPSSREVHEVKTFDDWKPASQHSYMFRFSRPNDSHLTEIPLKAISAARKKVIEEECKEPVPPNVPKIVRGKRDPSQLVPNMRDRGFLSRLREVNHKRTIMYLESCLTFDIPGETTAEKYEWVASRLVGDIMDIYSFVSDEMIGYRSRYNFFTDGFYQNNW